MFHSITQNPYSPNPMHYLQLSFLDPSSQGTGMTEGGTGMTGEGGYFERMSFQCLTLVSIQDGVIPVLDTGI
ncbi:hypothetical protein [Wolbachia endosymbiont of Dactylopius coccus]